jgi:hypothetical protein
MSLRYAPCSIRFTIFYVLYTDGEFDEEGCSLGQIIPDTDITIVIRDDGIDDGEP